MRNIRVIYLILALAFAFKAVPAQIQEPFKITKLTESISLISFSEIPGSTINVLVCNFIDGSLLVDALAEETIDDLKKSLDKNSTRRIKFLINTHSHRDHTGGNIFFARGAEVIGHEKLIHNMNHGALLFKEYPEYSFPTYTFTESMSIFFNDEEIKLIAAPGAHDNCDIFVYFTKSKIVCLGDLFYGDKFPSVDWINGNALKYPECVKKAIDMFPDDCTFVPGHGRPSSKAELIKFYDMLTGTIEIVKTELRKGKTIEQLQNEKVLGEWESFDGGYISADGWIKYIANWIQPQYQKKSLMEELYYILKEKGVSGVIERYKLFKDKESDKYMFNEGSMYTIASYVLQKRPADEALKICGFYVDEYPESTFALTLLGEAHIASGNNPQAKECFEKILLLNPEDSYAKEKINQLK